MTLTWRVLISLIVLAPLGLAAEAEEPLGRRIQGRWTHDGEPVVGEAVKLTAHGLPVRRETVSDTEGRFEFDELAPGRYRLTVDLLKEEGLEQERGIAGVRGGLVAKRVMVSSRDVTTEISTHSTSISGYLRDAEGRPVQVALLWLEPPGQPPDSWTGEWCRPADLSDVNGYYEFRGVPPGTYRLLARNSKLAPAWKSIELTAARPSLKEDLRLEDASPFVFRVFEPDGAVPNVLYLTVTDAHKRIVRSDMQRPQSDGSFSINLPVGRWLLWLRGGASFEIEAPGESRMSWRLPAMGRIRLEGYAEPRLLTVRLFDKQGEPLYTTDGGLSTGRTPYRSTVAAPIGTWTVEVSGPDDFRWSGEVDVAAEEESVVRLAVAE